MNINISSEPLFSSAEIRSLTSLSPTHEVSSTSSSSCSSTPLTSPSFSSPCIKEMSAHASSSCPSLFPCLNAQGMVDENMLNMFMMTPDIHSHVEPQLMSNYIKTHNGIEEVCFMMPDGSICDINTVNPEASQLSAPLLHQLAQQQMISSVTHNNSPQQAILSPSPSPVPMNTHTTQVPTIVIGSPVGLMSPKQQTQQQQRKKITTSLSGNKRKLEAEPLSPLNAADGLMANGAAGFEACPQLSPDEERSLKRQKRLVKNREAAQQFRQRQKNYISDLENKVEELTAINSEYASKMELMISENKIIREQLSRLHDFVSQALPGRQVPFPLMYMAPNNSSKDERSAADHQQQQASAMNHHIINQHAGLAFASPSPLLGMGMAMHPSMNNSSAADTSSPAPPCLPVDYAFPYGFYPHFAAMPPHLPTMSTPHHFHPMMNTTPVSAPAPSVTMQCSTPTDAITASAQACEQAVAN